MSDDAPRSHPDECDNCEQSYPVRHMFEVTNSATGKPEMWCGECCALARDDGEDEGE